MIIVDYSQVCIAAYMQAVGNHTNYVELEVIRYVILNSIRAINSKFRAEYGEMVLAIDSANSWRREFFPYYKAHRAEIRKASTVNWPELYQNINIIRDELEHNFPYKVIQVDGAEADDIIGTLARDCVNRQEKCLIVSGDKDFIQLHADNIFVKQWDNKNSKWVSHQEPKRYMFEHVVKGDLGDGIPNIYSDDDHYITKAKRAKAISTKQLNKWWEDGIGDLADTTHLKRNIKLIDLRHTPKHIQEEVITKFNETIPLSKSGIMSYIVKHGLKKLAPSIGDF